MSAHGLTVWINATQYATSVLAVVLILRLLRLRARKVYSVFCLFIGIELFQSLIVALWMPIRECFVRSHLGPPDYRWVWMLMQVPTWAVTLWIVYELLAAILRNFPGILRFSR